MTEDELKYVADTVTYGQPDNQAATRIIKHMSAMVLSKTCGASYTGPATVIAMLLGSKYCATYIETMSRAFHLWDTEVPWKARDLWVDRMLSDVRRIRQALGDSPVSFALRNDAEDKERIAGGFFNQS